MKALATHPMPAAILRATGWDVELVCPLDWYVFEAAAAGVDAIVVWAPHHPEPIRDWCALANALEAARRRDVPEVVIIGTYDVH